MKLDFTRIYGIVGKVACGVAGGIVGIVTMGPIAAIAGVFVGVAASHLLEKAMSPRPKSTNSQI
ncbi:MAG: hypothetical protein COT85_07885 [Chlamydiae bacterium CG10_big_fil_rev_8_21_14_0_10_42_34]|nr:MAG: hypothetical protein COT85_07885 [Chlamydiae bacterium CG10_big_fil_rev_8_21_14_0_10_42_34]